MANLPKSYLPIIESDQAEIIAIFNDLMRKLLDASSSTEAHSQEPVSPPSNVPDLGLQWGISGLE